ncbi:MAG: hypothetical protein IT365_16190 [Candidatus Hydrogenedentes bacterium]|nr:hypothetical protein [Candidatus Hydrogenedentota bacterium]
MIPRRFLPTAIAFALALPAYGYPEFQQFVKKNSGRGTNCAMCHLHPDGPEGLKPGQIGSLSTEEMNQLNQARAAFEPGQNVSNPILNAFGNSIIGKLGKTKFLQIRMHPEELPAALGDMSDLDHDGISDAQEYLAGTHPLDDSSGEPSRLLLINLRRYAFHLIMMVVATGAGLYGLNAILHWFDVLMSAARDKEEGNG